MDLDRKDILELGSRGRYLADHDWPGLRTNTALIFGITGQDGSYLAELLLSKHYNVIGVARRSSVDTSERLVDVKDHQGFTLVEGDITDSHCVTQLIREYQPRECYNLAAQSHVATSFKQPMHTADVDFMGVLHILEAIRHYSPNTRFYQASTSEMFGSNYTEISTEVPQFTVESLMEDHAAGRVTMPLFQVQVDRYQDENTPFSPNSPYAIAKLAAHNMVKLYRESYGMHASCGILFNHSGERRGEQFVERKISKWIGEYKAWVDEHGKDEDYYEYLEEDDIVRTPTTSGLKHRFSKLRLGNLDAKRDFGHAEDYTKAMYLMLQQDKPDDYVIASGKSYSIMELLIESFSLAGMDNPHLYIVIDPEFYRPCEVEFLLGNASKAKEKLGWTPQVSFKQLVRRMVENDIEKAKKNA